MIRLMGSKGKEITDKDREAHQRVSESSSETPDSLDDTSDCAGEGRSLHVAVSRRDGA